MRWLDTLARRMGRHYISNLMKYLVFAMAGIWVLQFVPLERNVIQFLSFNREKILRGEVWRVLTFVFLPPPGNSVWTLLNLYLYYIIAVALESRWGEARFNLYYLIGVAANIIAGFVGGNATNVYLNQSLILAFCVLYAESQLMLFFILPVKAKVFAFIMSGYFLYCFIFSSWPVRGSMLASFVPFALFFGKDAWIFIRMEYRRIRHWVIMRHLK